MPNLPLRAKFGLCVAAIAACVIGALGWLGLRVVEGQVAATFGGALSGVLSLTLAPATNVAPERQREAEARLREVMEEMEYVGVLAIELVD